MKSNGNEAEFGAARRTAPQSFRDSIAWQRGMELTEFVYTLTRVFPKEELFGLTTQLRRASVSVPSNIAEGQGRLSPGEFAHFLGMARGSALEVETQLELAVRLRLCTAEEARMTRIKALEVTRILNAVLSSLRKQNARPRRTPSQTQQP